MFRGIWFSIKDFEWYENISLRMMDWCKRFFNEERVVFDLSLISLVCSVFRKEERVVFIAIIVFFPLSCCLAFSLIFNQSSCFLWKNFLLKRFFNRNWYGCLAINQIVFFEKLFCLRDFSAVIDMVVLQSINQAIIFDYVNIFWKLFYFKDF